MTFSLHVDAERWRANAKTVTEAVGQATADDGSGGSGIVPVIKGNGYGLTLPRLAREAQRLSVPSVAVGTPFEVARVAAEFTGDILVLQPWDPRDELAAEAWQAIEATPVAARVIKTIASTDTLHLLARDATSPEHVVLEGMTSMRRFGLAEPNLDALLADDTIRRALGDGRLRLRGAAIHLPLTQPSSPMVATLNSESGSEAVKSSASNRVREAWGWAVTWVRALAAVEDTGVSLAQEAATVWVSHLDDDELRDLRDALPHVPIRLRVGTRLWLGDPDSLQACGTVLAVHPIDKGRESGYRQRRAARAGYLVVVGGGTSHGVGMAAPSSTTSMRQRAIAASTGALEAVGRARSPFSWANKLRWFAEPPHMQVSMVLLAEDDLREGLGAGYRTPAVGDTWPCRIRHTTATFDRIVGLD